MRISPVSYNAYPSPVSASKKAEMIMPVRPLLTHAQKVHFAGNAPKKKGFFARMWDRVKGWWNKFTSIFKSSDSKLNESDKSESRKKDELRPVSINLDTPMPVNKENLEAELKKLDEAQKQNRAFLVALSEKEEKLKKEGVKSKTELEEFSINLGAGKTALLRINERQIAIVRKLQEANSADAKSRLEHFQKVQNLMHEINELELKSYKLSNQLDFNEISEQQYQSQIEIWNKDVAEKWDFLLTPEKKDSKEEKPAS